MNDTLPMSGDHEGAGWWAEREAYADQPADLFAAAVDAGMLNLPLPGGGRTADRFAALAEVGEFDPVQACLAEGHTNALAILAELDGPLPGDDRWGVWPIADGLVAPAHRWPTASRTGQGWRIDGELAWCPGATICTRALVTAEAPDGLRFFAVENPGAAAPPGRRPVPDLAAGSVRCRAASPVRFVATPAVPVGGAGDPTDRPGFWHAAIGVAACWYGGAVGVARPLLVAARRAGIQPAGVGDGGPEPARAPARPGGRHAAEPEAPPVDPHLLANLGAVDARLAAAAGLLRAAGAAIDTDPKADARRLAGQVRATVELTVTKVLDRVGRALGAGPICLDPRHARRVADLTVTLRLTCPEPDAELTRLGEHLAAGGDPGW